MAEDVPFAYTQAADKQGGVALTGPSTKITNLGALKIVLADGGLINWSFLQEDLIDELILMLVPTANDSRQTATLFEKAEFLPDRVPATFRNRLKTIRFSCVIC